MRFGLSQRVMNQMHAFIIFALICAPLSGFSCPQGAAPQTQSIDVETFRIQAYAHHALALLYLSKGDVDKGLAEARAIIQQRIPPEFENAVAESMSKIADRLKDLRRYDLAQSLLDDTLKVMVQIPNRVSILKIKAGLYVLSGENDKAVDAWKRALDLEARIRQ
jgi:tetratricopeptide (TPR) repeat protein